MNYATYAASFDRNLAQILVSTDMVAVSPQVYTIPGLSPGVTYYFGLWTRDEVPGNWSGVSNTTSAWAQSGEVSTPTAPGGLSGLAVSSYSIHLNWTDNAVNEMGYRVLGSTPAIKAVLPADTTYYVESGLLPNTSYYRAAEAFNSAGASQGAPVALYTLSAPSSGAYVSSRSSWSVAIAWQANTNSAATRWGVERSTDNFAADLLVLVSSTDARTVRTYLDTGLADLTTYYYRVNSFNEEAFVSGYGAVISTVTLSTPTAPGGLSNAAVSPYSIRYDWADGAYNEDGYRIRSSTGILYLLPADATYYVETGLIPNTSYYREVEAYNGRGSAWAPFAVIYTSAAAPSGLYVVSRSSWNVLLGWQDGGNRAGTVWGIERSLTGSFASSTTLKTSTENYTALTYLDTGLANMTSYYYHVRGFNGDGFPGPYSLTVSTLTLSTPIMPAGFSGTAIDQTNIRWAWTDASNNEDGFNLRNNGGVLVASEWPGASFHTEGSLSPNLPYMRYVEAYNGAGSSATVKIAVYTMSAVPGINPSVDVTSYSAHISWALNGNPVGTFWGIERSIDGFGTSQTLKVFEDYYSAMDYLDTAVAPSTLYYYRVKSYNGAGLESATAGTLGLTLPEIIPDVTPPAAVTDLTAAQGQVGGEIIVSWTAPGDDGLTGDITGGSLKIHYVTSSTTPLDSAQAGRRRPGLRS